ncbi:MAG: VWA domain-containing protein [Acidobacteriia bacterium]|nr:VWA domain-containing protein [Terriglobia bacterium]
MPSFSCGQLRVLALHLACITLLATAAAQEPQKPAEQQAGVYQSLETLKSTTRLVVVDVVAFDNKGQPALGLQADDFVVYEDGRPQKISSFGLQRGGAAPVAAPATPNGVFSNAPAYKEAHSLNIILLDALNAEFESYAYARDQLIKYLDSGPSIQPTAVYALEEKLTLLYGFTVDTKVLKAVILDYRPKAPTHVLDVYSAASPFARKGDFKTSARSMEVTIAALNNLAQSLAGYPGRKNLIWLSETFPLTLFPEIISNDPNPAAFDPATHRPSTPIVPATTANDPSFRTDTDRDFVEEVEKVANLMMTAQVAIYPVDAAGLERANRFNAMGTMRSLAERTGGKAYFGRNNLEEGVRSSIDDGSTYYTLSYYPENKNWDGRFRVVQVKTARGGITLRHRQGYYALDPSPGDKDAEKALGREFSYALSLDSPGSTAVQFKAQIAQTTPKVLVKFAIDPHSLVFSSKDKGQERAFVSCAVAAYSEKGAFVKQEITSMNTTVKHDELPKLMAAALGCERAIELKPGNYSLVLGVVDRSSRLIGTTTAWVKVK